MFNKHKNEEPQLDGLLETLLIELTNDHDKADTDAYARRVEQVVKLHALKTSESRPRISADAILAAGVNIATVLVIVGYEQKNLLASKAFSFVRRL